MASVSTWETKVDAFVAAPSAATALAMEGEYVKLPRSVSGDGASVAFSSLAELRAWTAEKISAALAADTKRVITARTNYGGLR